VINSSNALFQWRLYRALSRFAVTSSAAREVDLDVIIRKLLDSVFSVRFEQISGDIPEHGGTRNKFQFSKKLSGTVSAPSFLTPHCSLSFANRTPLFYLIALIKLYQQLLSLIKFLRTPLDDKYNIKM
jgi:hypothetical protein